jgi:hypothetical protein
MPKEFLLLIHNKIENGALLSEETQQQFLRACESYIDQLKSAGRLKSAQPLLREGTFLSASSVGWNEAPFVETGEVIVGYYHLLAADLHEAVMLAKENPEFKYKPTARIEVRPIKTKEVSTGYAYVSGDTQTK